MPATRWRVFIFFLAFLIPAASPLSFNMSSITFSDRGRFNVSGNTVVDAGGIQITPSKDTYTKGRATYNQPLLLWDKSSTNLTDFTTHFSFTIDSDGNAEYGDGMAFFLAPVDTPLDEGSFGGGLGLGYGQPKNSTTSPFNFVAVEFDTFLNSFDPPFPDRPETGFYPHVGIDINSMRSSNYTPWRNDITKGFQSDAWISYNATTLMLTVEFTGRNGSITQRGSLGYKVDLRAYLPEFVAVGFSAATGRCLEQHDIKSWSFSSTLVLNPIVQRPNSKNKNKNEGLIYGLSVGLSLLILGISAFAFFLMRKRKKEKKEEGVVGGSIDLEFQESIWPRRFSYEELIAATNNFAIQLGEGGFGCVYKGVLTAPNTNTDIAVKKVSERSKQGRKEYAAEVKIISKLRHINLVQLMGWCHQGSELLLVYEFMPNGSLDSHLFNPNSMLTWEIRHRVAKGLASALLYLHEELGQYVVHRDIKASNIMLDSNFNAKLGDFGLARLVDHDKDMHSSNFAGTIGYIAPEYLATGTATKETDVYSFGVVLLEITCGRRPVDHEFFNNQVVSVEWVWSLYGSGRLLDAADPKLDSSEYDARKIEHLMVVGLWCVHPDSSQRPSMRQVVQVLNSEASLPRLPLAMPKPVFYYNNASRVASSSSTTHSGGGASSSAGPTSYLVSQTDPTPVFQQPQPFNAAAAAAPSFVQQQQPTKNDVVQQVVNSVIDGPIDGARLLDQLMAVPVPNRGTAFGSSKPNRERSGKGAVLVPKFGTAEPSVRTGSSTVKPKDGGFVHGIDEIYSGDQRFFVGKKVMFKDVREEEEEEDHDGEIGLVKNNSCKNICCSKSVKR